MRRDGATSRRFGTVRGIASDSWTADSLLEGFNTFSSTNHWDFSAADDATNGTATQCGYAVTKTNSDPSGGGSQYFFGNANGNTSGWVYRFTNSVISVAVVDGGGTLRSASAETVVADDIGDSWVWGHSFSSGTLDAYSQGVNTATTSSITGYTVATEPCALGNRPNNGAPLTHHSLAGGYFGSDATMDDTAHSDLYSAVQTGIDVVDPATSATEEILVNFEDASASPASFTDRLAGLTINKQGTGGTFESWTPTWGTS